MKLTTISNLLTNRTGVVLPGEGDYIAAAIHPSSEVDLCDIGDHRLGVGAIVPVPPRGFTAKAVRYPLPATGFLAGHTALDGQNVIGEKLVLQLYDKCDPLIPPGPRSPVFRHYGIGDGNLPATSGTASLVFRLPMHGRARAIVSFERDEDLDLYIEIFGRRMGTYDDRERPITSGTNNFTVRIGSADNPYSWRDGGIPPAGYGGVALNFAAKQINLENERFDELLVYAYGTAGGSGSSYFSAEAFGEGAA